MGAQTSERQQNEVAIGSRVGMGSEKFLNLWWGRKKGCLKERGMCLGQSAEQILDTN